MIRRVTSADLKALDMLRRQESEAVGFIPMDRYEMECDGRRNGRLWLFEENADPVGFLYATFGQIGHVQQVIVRHDARRAERATALIEAFEIESRRRGLSEAGCRVGVDLEAIEFWEALGFELVGYRPGGERRSRVLAVYRKALQPRLLEAL